MIEQPPTYPLSLQLNNIPSPIRKNKEKHKLTDILTIGTININYLTDYKQNMITNIMNETQIHILGIAETHLTNKQTKYYLKNDQKYIGFFNNDDTTVRETGVGIIIDREYAKHIFNIGYYKGRIIYLDLMFKKKTKIRIIQFYGKPLSQIVINKRIIQEFQKEVTNLVKTAKATNMEVILMGDFNTHYEKYTTNKSLGRRTAWQHKIFEKIEEKYNMFDPIQVFYDISPKNPLPTYYSEYRRDTSTRIDYIWVTEKYLQKVKMVQLSIFLMKSIPTIDC
jgi:exonuclease III